MAYKASKKSKLISVILPNRIFSILKSYCDETNISVSEYIRNCVIVRLEELSLIKNKMQEEMNKVERNRKV